MRKKAFTYTLLTVSALFLCSGGLCWAIPSITATGSWSQNIGASNLTGGAGSNLNDTYQSDPAAVLITIADTSGAWTVDVKKVDTNWNSNLLLYIQRTSNGGNGTISGGGTYQEVMDTGQFFFSGNGGVTNMNVQLKLMGVSIQIPPVSGGYTTTVTYTVTGP